MKFISSIFSKAVVAIIASAFVFSCSQTSEKDNWLQYRDDAGRSGYTPHIISDDLVPSWIHHFGDPDKSWTGIHSRMIFDHAIHPVISGDIVCVGNSIDGKVYAFDKNSGKTLWTFYTDAPVRFAPVIWKDKLFAISDDGYLYCLSLKNGDLLWKKYGGTKMDMVLGNGRMISRWPVRGGIAIEHDTLYFGAGIWPSEKIFIYALNPENGNELWVNDACGDIYMAQPHGGANAESGLSAQGYLAIGGNKLFIPTGRAVPAALNKKTGELEYFHLQKYRNYGGASLMATDSLFFASAGNTRDLKEVTGTKYAAFSNDDGLILSNEFNSEAVAIGAEYIFSIDNTSHKLKAYKRDSLKISIEDFDRKGKKYTYNTVSLPAWEKDLVSDYAKVMIATGNRLIAGTSTGKVLIIDKSNGEIISILKVDGNPLGLAVAQKALFVSTDKGMLYCFDESNKNPKVYFHNNSNFKSKSEPEFVEAAEEILSKADSKNGYCLDISCGDGSLVLEIAKRSNFRIIALDSDEENVAKARKKLSEAGLYGDRVVVYHGNISNIPLPDYFANLIVSGESVKEGVVSDEIIKSAGRCQRPSGGTMITGKKSEMQVDIRGALANTGDWTHLYHDPANTTNSGDELVKGELEMLWFDDPNYEMPSRHGRGMAPLYKDGRMFVQGKNGIRAVDAYNGTTLWEYYIEELMGAYDQEHLCGTAITNSNWCMEDDRIYVRRGMSLFNWSAKSCEVINAKTGVKIGGHKTPNEGYWGYIAVKDGVLFGTVADPAHIATWAYGESDMNSQFSESSSFFAMDATTGKVLWEYKAKKSIRHNSIAIGNGTVYLIDRDIADFDKLAAHKRRGQESQHPTGELLALDALTGKVLFSLSNNIWGTLLMLSEEHNKLVMGYSDTRFSLPSEKSDRIAAFSSETGKKLWETKTRQNLESRCPSRSRPILNDDKVFIEPETIDLFSGEVLDNSFRRSYGCGIITASKNTMLFRSATVGYYDIDNPDAGIKNYGGIRPGCWINTLPVGGLVLMPDATTRCNCSYLIKSWIALKPKS